MLCYSLLLQHLLGDGGSGDRPFLFECNNVIM